ncbi:MAG: hypothetical protein ACKO8Z_07465, partial [Prosthecobacter sp.]
MENARPIDIVVTNLKREAIKGALLKTTLGGKTEEFILPDLAAGKSYTAKFTPNTTLKPAEYELQVRFEIGDYSTKQSKKLQIIGRLPPRMPVIMWGAGGNEIPRLKEIGFTHFVGFSDQGAPEMWKEKKLLPPGSPETIAQNRTCLDDALANGLEVIASLSPDDTLAADAKNLRVNRKGVSHTRKDIIASIPEFAPFFQTLGASMGKTYG